MPAEGSSGVLPIETDALIVGAGPVGLFAVFELGLVEHGGEGASGRHRRLPARLQELRQRAGLDQRNGGRICRYVLHKAAPGLRGGCRCG